MSVRLTTVALACLISTSALALADNARLVNIPAGNLIEGLESLAKQCGVDIIYPSEQLKGLKTRGVSGTLEPKDAFHKLLEGTPLILKQQGDALLITLPSASIRAVGGTPSDAAGQDGQAQEGKSNSSGNFLLVQTHPSGSSSSQTVGNPSESSTEDSASKRQAVLEEVLVTGSRLQRTAKESAQEVHTYTADQISQSGQASVAEFLNTVPDVSVASNAYGNRSIEGGGAVQLHGLPVGTTLVLINGRRIGTSGAQAALGYGNFFDLNSLPLAAVDRIEVLSVGSSAVYGSDAIAGVVNIILRKRFDGVELSGRYGDASGTTDKNAELTAGKTWTRGSFSIVGSYQSQSELQGSQRSITATGDFRAFGGKDTRSPIFCSPANIYGIGGPLPGLGAATFAAVPVGFTGTPTQQEFAATAGTLNTCSASAFETLIPPAERSAVSAFGNYQLAPTAEVFTELMYSHVRQSTGLLPPFLLGLPSFQVYTVGAGNPYNPFGQRVGISANIASLGRIENRLDTDFSRPLIGVRGTLTDSWHWEVAAWSAQERSRLTTTNVLNHSDLQSALNASDRNTALNPFVDGPWGSTALLESVVFDRTLPSDTTKTAINGFVSGSLLRLPAGWLNVVIGAEFDHDKLSWFDASGFLGAPGTTEYRRDSYALFGEARIPLVPKAGSANSDDMLVASLATRLDHDQFFGNKTTPQFGIEWRPIASLLVRAGYGGAFKAPSLQSLFAPSQTTIAFVSDPKSGGVQVGTNLLTGGNPGLRPEVGHSTTAGFVYVSDWVPGLKLSVTHWTVNEDNSIQILPTQAIVDNEALFPGRVVRNSAGTITLLDDTSLNFGTTSVRGLDYQLAWRHLTPLGEIQPSVTATQTYRYTAALLPGAPPTDRAGKANDDYNWAPTWKLAAVLDWKIGSATTHIVGRYVSHYRDYDPAPTGNYLELGGFWLIDANVRYNFGEALSRSYRLLTGAYVQVGGVNIFNTLPQYSNNANGFDGTQADIRGRFLYGQFGVKW